MRSIQLIILILYCLNCDGQGKTNLFQGGYDNAFGSLPFGGNYIDFYSGLPTIGQEFRIMDYNYTGTNITDNVGNLLFATNGVIVMNNNNDTMFNGAGLNPSQYTTNFGNGLRLIQPDLILPDLMDPNQYHLFHMTLDQIIPSYQSNYFYYSKIDVSLNGGMGEVTQKNQILYNGSFAPNRLTACKHANGRDWWIIVVQINGADLYTFLLTPNGPAFSHIQSSAFRLGSGQAVFSPDGTRYGAYSTDDDFEVWDFDRCSGMLNNYRKVAINDSMVSAGAAFSPNSSYLYGSSSNYLYQINASSNQPDTTLITVALWDGFYCPNPPFSTGFFIQQLAHDGKIYSSTGNGTCVMHSIESPDSAGLACNVQQHSVILPTYNVGTMPNHPNYNLGPLIGSGCDTLSSINELYETAPLQLNAFPNPVISDNFEINYSLAQNQTGELLLLDATGRVVFQKTLPQWSSYQKLQVPGLSSGLYLLRLESGYKTALFKFVKQDVQ